MAVMGTGTAGANVLLHVAEEDMLAVGNVITHLLNMAEKIAQNSDPRPKRLNATLTVALVSIYFI